MKRARRCSRYALTQPASPRSFAFRPSTKQKLRSAPRVITDARPCLTIEPQARVSRRAFRSGAPAPIRGVGQQGPPVYARKSSAAAC